MITQQPTKLEGLAILDGILEKIIANPLSWYQGDWRTMLLEDGYYIEVSEMGQYESDEVCGTAFCIAGHTVAATGAAWHGVTSSVELDEQIKEQIMDEVSTHSSRYRRCEYVYVDDYAQWALNIIPAQAEDLFNGSNRWEDVVKVRNEIATAIGTPIRAFATPAGR
jgi:hypothetical protein